MKRSCNSLKGIDYFVSIITLFFSLYATNVVGDVAEDTNRLLDWAEANYPDLFLPPNQPTLELNQYLYRYYPITQSYAGVHKNNLTIHVLGDAFGDGIQYVDTLQNQLVFIDANPIVPNSAGTGGCVKLGHVAEGTQTTVKEYDQLQQKDSDIVELAEITYLTVSDVYTKWNGSFIRYSHGIPDWSIESESESTHHLADGYWYLNREQTYLVWTSYPSGDQTTPQTVSQELDDVYDSPGYRGEPETLCQGDTWESPSIHFSRNGYDRIRASGFGLVEAVNQMVTTRAGTFNTVRIRKSWWGHQNESLSWIDIDTGIEVIKFDWDGEGDEGFWLEKISVLESIQ